MLKANTRAQLESNMKQLNQVDKDIWKLANVISGLNKQLDILRREKEDLEFKIQELEEDLEDEYI